MSDLTFVPTADGRGDLVTVSGRAILCAVTMSEAAEFLQGSSFRVKSDAATHYSEMALQVVSAMDPMSPMWDRRVQFANWLLNRRG